MKKLYFLSILLIGAILAGCNNEDFIDNIDDTTKEETRTIRVYLTDDSDTRVALTEDGKNTIVTWKTGDMITLIMKQDDAKQPAIAVVKEGQVNGKYAQWFEIEINKETIEPENIFKLNKAFTLYATHGGRGADENGNMVVNEHSRAISTNLQDLVTNNAIMMSGSAVVEPTDNEVTVKLKHLGTLFKIKLKNDRLGANLLNVHGMKLTTDNPGNLGTSKDQVGFPIHINTASDLYYDPIRNIFGTYKNNLEVITHKVANSVFELQFSTTTSTMSNGSIRTFWAWVPVDANYLDNDGNTKAYENITWPEFSLEIRRNQPEWAKSDSSKPGKDNSQNSIGKTINLYAIYSGQSLAHTNRVRFATSEELGL